MKEENRQLKQFKYVARGEERMIIAEPLYSEISVTAIESLYQYRLAPKFTHPGERHDLHEFFYVIQGNMKVITSKTTYYLTEGDFIIIPPNTFHSMWPDKCYSYSVSIAFSCEGLNDDLTTLKIAKLNQLEKDCLTSAVKNYTHNFETDRFSFPFTSKPANEYAFRQIIKNELEKLLIFITRDFEEQEHEEKERLSEVNLSIAEKVKQYIEEHYKEKILLEEISDAIGYSVGHLSRTFKKKNEISVVNYILLRRVQEAMLMLDRGDALQQVSDELGFDSVQYFCKIFKRFTNITPKRYQQTAGKDHYIVYDMFVSALN